MPTNSSVTSGIHTGKGPKQGGFVRSTEQDVANDVLDEEGHLTTENLPMCTFDKLPEGKVCKYRTKEERFFFCAGFNKECPFS